MPSTGSTTFLKPFEFLARRWPVIHFYGLSFTRLVDWHYWKFSLFFLFFFGSTICDHFFFIIFILFFTISLHFLLLSIKHLKSLSRNWLDLLLLRNGAKWIWQNALCYSKIKSSMLVNGLDVNHIWLNWFTWFYNKSKISEKLWHFASFSRLSKKNYLKLHSKASPSLIFPPSCSVEHQHDKVPTIKINRSLCCHNSCEA